MRERKNEVGQKENGGRRERRFRGIIVLFWVNLFTKDNTSMHCYEG